MKDLGHFLETPYHPNPGLNPGTRPPPQHVLPLTTLHYYILWCGRITPVHVRCATDATPGIVTESLYSGPSPGSRDHIAPMRPHRTPYAAVLPW